MSESDFLEELVSRSGCRLLCDVSNIVVSAHNMGYDAWEYVDRLPACAIAQFHLGGFTSEPDAAFPGAEVLIDTHAAGIAESSWALYAHAVRRFGAKPALIEWDSEIPELATLTGEAARADRIAAWALSKENSCAPAC